MTDVQPHVTPPITFPRFERKGIAVRFAMQTQTSRWLSAGPPQQKSTRYEAGEREQRLYSQLLEIGEVLENVGRKLRDVVHAQVTVEGKKHRLGVRKWGRRKTKK